MKEVHAWEVCRSKMKKLEVLYTVNTDAINVIGKSGMCLGRFHSAIELVNYLYGYESGLMDKRLYNDN